MAKLTSQTGKGRGKEARLYVHTGRKRLKIKTITGATGEEGVCQNDFFRSYYMDGS